jgi:hypothetical protein
MSDDELLCGLTCDDFLGVEMMDSDTDSNSESPTSDNINNKPQAVLLVKQTRPNSAVHQTNSQSDVAAVSSNSCSSTADEPFTVQTLLVLVPSKVSALVLFGYLLLKLPLPLVLLSLILLILFFYHYVHRNMLKSNASV